MAVGVFQDYCGLTVVQYARMDREITSQRDLYEQQTFVGHIPYCFPHTREDNEQTNAGYGEHRYAAALHH